MSALHKWTFLQPWSDHTKPGIWHCHRCDAIIKAGPKKKPKVGQVYRPLKKNEATLVEEMPKTRKLLNCNQELVLKVMED